MFALEAKPYIDSHGQLVIPFTCAEKYHYWRHGKKHMRLAEILDELNAEYIQREYVLNRNAVTIEIETETNDEQEE